MFFVFVFCQHQGWFSNPEFSTSILAPGWVSSKSLLLDRVSRTLTLALSSTVAENDLELLISLPLSKKELGLQVCTVTVSKTRS